ncbi:pseudouridine synthase [Ganoderma leucocontextum]|nr:pseudouridine synthase [Ganoderma leucocontextum]
MISRSRRNRASMQTSSRRSSRVYLRNKLGLKEPLRTLHRLDKPATGALAFACHRQSARDFSNQMSGRQVEKTYLALVVAGASAFPEKQGVIETKLECRNGWVSIPGIKDVYERDRSQLRSARRRGEHWSKDAVSEYEVLASSPKLPLSLLRLRLHTGLKHQLRVHLAQALRTPILGDALYLDPRSPQLRDIKAAIDLPRTMFLHSSRLSLNRYCPGRVTLAIGAPLSVSFVSVCEAAGIPLERDHLLGGVWVDGTKALGPDAVPDDDTTHAVEGLAGKWYWRARV